MHVAHPSSRKQSDLDCPQQLHTAEVSPTGIELPAPPAKLGSRNSSEVIFELRTTFRLERRRLEQRIDESPDVESRTSDYDRLAPQCGGSRNRFACHRRPLRRGITLSRIGDVDAFMRYRFHLAPFRLCGADVEAAIDLSGISADYRRAMLQSKTSGDR